MNKNIFIGGAWPYANYFMHVGHLAALLPGDVIARFHRKAGNNVIYVSGSDCHGTPITKRAKDENKQPAEIAEYYHTEFENDFNALDFSYDLYTKTTTKHHEKHVQEFFRMLLDNGYFYEKEIDEEYSEKSNKFLTDRDIVGNCNFCGALTRGDQCDNCHAMLNLSDLKNKIEASTGEPVSYRKNKHLYFKLSSFQNELEKFLPSKLKVWRNNAYNETAKFLKQGLIDRAATRQIDWGVNTNIAGFEDKKVYVWIEAVLGYLTAGIQVGENKGFNFLNFLKNSDNLISYYVHGKDNIPFHTLIFPAILLGLKQDFQLPYYIVSSEYVTRDGEKMSKSQGNILTVKDLLSAFPKETIRFYTLFNNPEKKDGNFSVSEIIQQHNKFLVGGLGNFVNRNVSFLNKKFYGEIIEAEINEEVINETKQVYLEVYDLLVKGEIKTAITKVFDYISFANKFYDAQQPWKQVTENIQEFNKTTYSCVYIIANIANLLEPFIPSVTNKINSIFGLEKTESFNPVQIKGNLKIVNSDLLFTRIDEKDITLD